MAVGEVLPELPAEEEEGGASKREIGARAFKSPDQELQASEKKVEERRKGRKRRRRRRYLSRHLLALP